MDREFMKYNPAFLSDTDLISRFVVRQVDMELIIDTVRQNIGAPADQHVLVVGPRGIGKTTLVLRVAAEIRNDPELGKHWYPLVFSEESYEVASPGEFWLKALFHLAEETGDPRWQKTYDDLHREHDEVRLRERALAQLMDFADEQGKRILLVVENLHMILGEQMTTDDAWVLRHPLLNEPRLMLLASATSRFEGIEGTDKAMYDLLKVHELRPLDDENCRVFWSTFAGDLLPGNRIRPIQILTGGNPRLLSIIAAFAAKSSFRDLMNNLTKLVDDHTDYFKSHLECLPAQERKVFCALADIWDPATASEVAAATRMPVNKVSAQLLRLTDKGAVTAVEERKGKKRYQVAERLYNIYYLMRRRGQPSSRVRAVVEFMIHFYEEEDLVRTVKSIAEEASSLMPEQRSDHYLAFAEILRHANSLQLRRRLSEAVSGCFVETSDAPDIIRQFLVCADEDKASLPQNENEVQAELDLVWDDSQQLTRLGHRLHKNRAWDKYAEQAFRRALDISPGGSLAWLGLGMVLSSTSEGYGDAEAAYRKAIECNPKLTLAWGKLGELLHKHLGRPDEAERAYRQAVNLESDNGWVLCQLGQLLATMPEKRGEAYDACIKVASSHGECPRVWVQLGRIHQDRGQMVEAERAFRRATEVDGDYPRGWGNLAILLLDTERPREAEDAFTRAIELDPRYGSALARFGELLETTGRLTEAEHAYRQAVSIREDHWTQARLAKLLRRTSRMEEAEEACRKAIDLDPSCVCGWFELGTILRNKDSEGALQALRKAAELDPAEPSVWAELGIILDTSLGRYEDAEECYREAIRRIAPGDTYALPYTLYGLMLCSRLHRDIEAFDLLKKAVVLDPTAPVWDVLVGLHEWCTAGDDSAVESADRFITELGRHPQGLNALANRFMRYGRSKCLSAAETWAREAVEKMPSSSVYQVTLAEVLAHRGEWDDSLMIVSQVVSNYQVSADIVTAITELSISASASGHARTVIALLSGSDSQPLLEPLVCGLRMFLGQEINVAEEIKEVAKDIVKRIKKQQKSSTRKSKRK